MQTVYADEIPVAHPGQSADTGHSDVISRLAEQDIPFGVLLVPGTDADDQCLVPTSAAEVTNGVALGVAMYDPSKPPEDNSSDFGWNDEESVSIKQKGRVWVRCDAAASITANSAAYVRYASGAGGTVLGVFRQNDPGSEAAALPGAVFRSAHRDVVFQSDTYRIALLEINLPVTV